MTNEKFKAKDSISKCFQRVRITIGPNKDWEGNIDKRVIERMQKELGMVFIDDEGNIIQDDASDFKDLEDKD